jgi:glycosyltransferase involved in cell wall biosynthesis
LVTEHVVPFNWNPTPAKTRAADIAALYRYVVEPIKEMDRHCRECAEEINRGGFDFLFANSSLLQAAASIGRYVKIPKVIYLQEPNRRLYEAGLQDGADGWLHEPEMAQLPWVAPPWSEKFWSPKYLKLFLRNTVRVQALRVQAREELLNARAYDAILVNSMFSRESMLRAYGLDAKVCYLGIDTDKFSNLHLTRENFVVGLGAIHFYKNIKLVIEALAKVQEPRPPLIWIGDSAVRSHLDELMDLARAVGVNFEPKIKIGDDELVHILNRARLMVYAPRLEPFGFAPLEANACGLPVVAVAEGGVRETIIDGVNGLLVEHDARELAAAIQHLMSNKAYAYELGNNGCNLVAERWSLSAAVDRLERRFEEVIARHGSKQETSELTNACAEEQRL